MAKFNSYFPFIFTFAASIVGSCGKSTTSRYSLSANGSLPVLLFIQSSSTAYVLAEGNINDLTICRSTKDRPEVTCKKNDGRWLGANTYGKEVGGAQRNLFMINLPPIADVLYLTVSNSINANTFRHIEIKDRNQNADPMVTALSLINVEEMKADLTKFSSDEFEGRGSGTKGNEAARNWLVERLKNYGIPPAQASGDYLQYFPLPKGGQSANIIGKIEGSDPALKDRYVVIGAHMDHIGKALAGGELDDGKPAQYYCKKLSNDEICNGADDNGSGTISVLHVAKALAAIRHKLKRTVIVIFFSGEEFGLVGSKYYVEKNPVVPIQLTFYMINMDMVGYMRNNKLMAIGGDSTQEGQEIVRMVHKKYQKSHNINIQITSEVDGGSDHAPFNKATVPIVFYNTGVRDVNVNYHRASDSAEKINYEGMTLTAKIAFDTAVNAANHPSQKLQLISSRQSQISDEEYARSCHDLHGVDALAAP